MLRRLIHNSLHTLKKDNGAYFTYNIGVGFVRAALLLIVAAVLVFSWYHFKLFAVLHYEGKTTATLKGYWRVCENHSDIDWINEHFAKYHYYIVLEYDYATITEYVSEETFNYYDDLAADQEDREFEGIPGLQMNVYSTDSRFGNVYLSPKNISEATAECQASFPPAGAEKVSVWLIIIAVPLLLIGLKQQRLAMKYPRSDVDESGETGLSVVPEQDGGDLPTEPGDPFAAFGQNTDMLPGAVAPHIGIK